MNFIFFFGTGPYWSSAHIFLTKFGQDFFNITLRSAFEKPTARRCLTNFGQDLLELLLQSKVGAIGAWPDYFPFQYWAYYFHLFMSCHSFRDRDISLRAALPARQPRCRARGAVGPDAG
jgi:hypothetical protein